MSHFSSLQTKLVDRTALVAGLNAVLTAMGITPVIAVLDQPGALENSYDPTDRQSAHVIVRRRCIPRPNWREGIAAIDIGFRQEADGTFSVIADAWDINDNAIGDQYSDYNKLGAFLNAVQIEHNKAYVLAQYPVSQWAQSDWVTTEDGSLQLTLTQKVNLAMV
jgi:Protein of unknown function (DUF1257)